MKRSRLLLLLIAGFCCTSAIQSRELHLFAAASLSNALKEVGETFAEIHGTSVVFNFGASGSLALQIREGAPADVFISADATRMDALQHAGLLLEPTRCNILRNTLVVVLPADSDTAIRSIKDLAHASLRRIAIGEPATVPAGSYTRTFLEQAAIWNTLHPKLIPLNNVRAVLAAVASANADAGFVYATDARISDSVRIALYIPPTQTPDILYPAAVLKRTQQPELASAFVRFLLTAPAQEVFVRHGFLKCD